MNLPDYTIEIEPTLTEIKEKKYHQIGIQLPEGLKNIGPQIAKTIETTTNTQTYLLADPCYGACDIPTHQLTPLNLDLLIHIGHEPLTTRPPSTFPITYLPAHATIDPIPIITKTLPHLTNKKIALFTTAQHLHHIPKITNFLKKHNITIITPPQSTRTPHPHQILGCDFTTAQNLKDTVDLFLYLGSGFFHPLGIKLATNTPVLIADPYKHSLQQTNLDNQKDAILRQRYGAIALAKQSQRFGILLTTKIGQHRQTLSNHLKKLLTDAGKESYIFIIDRITPQLLSNFRTIDCFISTACPRIAIDDYHLYKKPLITPQELEIALGKRKWEHYLFDQITENK